MATETAAAAADLIIRNGTIVSADAATVGSIAIKDGRVLTIGADAAMPAARESLDASGLHVLPGAIDVHVHVDPDAPGTGGVIRAIDVFDAATIAVVFDNAAVALVFDAATVAVVFDTAAVAIVFDAATVAAVFDAATAAAVLDTTTIAVPPLKPFPKRRANSPANPSRVAPADSRCRKGKTR